ncbi:hypothetical protein Vretimale_3542 [Volvox reticuliferus]|uniref:Hexosyltransferase n=1 Tax=Volvox reticuliferus TaxID=1737510 RepID=A0A8J4DA60_9CHLO|nr:hypothetical protein Vretimale_3542 [Volvox reticuliferus]
MLMMTASSAWIFWSRSWYGVNLHGDVWDIQGIRHIPTHWPRHRFYWGYVWDGSSNRRTAPIRNPANKSYMPQEQYPLDYYPPFASGCGFVLSRDLVQALLSTPLPDYRLLVGAG